MFSKRYFGIEKEVLQINDIDKKLKVDLWNTVLKYYLNTVCFVKNNYGIFENQIYSYNSLDDCKNNNLIIDLYENFFIEPINNLRDKPLNKIKGDIERLYNELPWYQVYDLIEFIYQSIKSQNFKKDINFKLERNSSAYRLTDEGIAPISNDEEIETILQASKTRFESVNLHIKKAIQLFNKRENVDYENTIKESITAVETMCSIIVGNSTTLGCALKKLEDNGVLIHPALKLSFEKLYGYTSDANGIRHAGDIGGPNSTFSEAKFMLISCSAFINYLIENYIQKI